MGDRVAVMKDGYLQQVDTPLNLYDKPVNLFVAGFIGSPQMNLMSATAQEGKAKIGDYLVPVDEAAAHKVHGEIVVGVRPEAWRRSPRRRRPAGRRHRRGGARRGRVRLRHQRRRGHAQQHHRPGLGPRRRAQGRRDPRDHRSPPACTSSTPSRASASASEAPSPGRPTRGMVWSSRVNRSNSSDLLEMSLDLCDVEPAAGGGCPGGRGPRSEPSRSAVATCPPPHRHARQAAPAGSLPAHADKRPNIVLVLMDDFSLELLATMPEARRMRAAGATYRNAHVVDSLCCPSRASIFTGQAAAPDRGADQRRRTAPPTDRRLPRVRPQRQRPPRRSTSRCTRAATRPVSSAST